MPLTFSGNRLIVNYATRPGGSLRVELQDAAGKPVSSFTLKDCHLQYGDQLDRMVSWQSGAGVSELRGQPLRLRFKLKDADLYSFQFTLNEVKKE